MHGSLFQKGDRYKLEGLWEAIRSRRTVNADTRPSLANLAVALAAGLAMLTYAGALTDPTAAAEAH